MQRYTIAAVGVAALLVIGLGSAGMAMALTSGEDSPQNLQTADSPAESTPSITVTAQGEAEAEPDKAVLRIAVETSAPDATTARTQVAENISAVRAALADLGIEDDQIRSSDYRIFQDRPRTPDREKPEEPVYRARHTLTIDLYDVDTVGEVLDATVDAGATDVRDVSFTLSEDTRETIRKEALAAAMDNARGQADTIAESAGLSIAGVHEATTNDYRSPVVRYEAAGMAQASASGGTDISSGPVSVTAQVTVNYNASG